MLFVLIYYVGLIKHKYSTNLKNGIKLFFGVFMVLVIHFLVLVVWVSYLLPYFGYINRS